MSTICPGCDRDLDYHLHAEGCEVLADAVMDYEDERWERESER